jgi:hypothetical protein
MDFFRVVRECMDAAEVTLVGATMKNAPGYQSPKAAAEVALAALNLYAAAEELYNMAHDIVQKGTYGASTNGPVAGNTLATERQTRSN